MTLPCRGNRRILVRGGIQYAILLLLVSACSLLPGPPPVSATIITTPLSPNSSSSSTATADVSTRKYQSQPALFGMQLEYDASYDAILQAIPDDPHLCAGKTTNDATNEMQRDEGKNLYGYPNTNTDANMIFLPQYGESVALLAKRGVCSFEDKARTALAVDAELRHRLRKRRSNDDASGRHNGSKSVTENDDTPLVQFVVVYDDIHRPSLVPMSASDDDDIDKIGLVFVSSDAGDELLALVESDAESNSEYRDGGVPITIDATAPWGGYGYTYHYGLYGEDYPRQFILAAMAGFFMCLALLGCLLLCAQAGIISTDGSLVIFGRTLADEIMARQTARRRERPRLLTEDQVLALPVVHYCASASAVDATHHRINRTESMPSSVTTAHSLLERRSASSLDYRARNAFNVCDICIEEYVDGEVLTELPCGHRYHVECLLPWLTKRSSLCPHCRADVWDADPYAETSPDAFTSPSTSTPLVGADRTTADTYGSTSFGGYSPLRYLRDAWQSSASLSDEVDIGIGARHEFSDSDTEGTNTSRVQATRLMSDSLGNE